MGEGKQGVIVVELPNMTIKALVEGNPIAQLQSKFKDWLQSLVG